MKVFKYRRWVLASALVWGWLWASPVRADWLTFGHDPRRSGWAPEETALNPKAVGGLKLKWKVAVNNRPYSLAALTAPVGATGIKTEKGVRNLVIVAGISGGVFAIDANTGEQVWNRTLRVVMTERKGGLQGTFLCPEGITA